MPNDPAFILSVLDQCAEKMDFPMLDNGYVYLAASRLSLHYSGVDWAMVIEIFGYSPRGSVPDLQIYTIASRLHERNAPSSYVSSNAYANYLAYNSNNDSRFFFPIAEGAWMDQQAPEMFELCRYLAFTNREEVLATVAERRVSVPPELEEILVLDDWHHPDLCNNESQHWRRFLP